MTLIILEGPDGAGKTTLADRLAAEHGDAVVWHRGPPTTHDMRVEYEEPITTIYDPVAPQLIICDRWHIGELIYGPILRGVSRLTLEMRHHIDMVLASRGCVLVHVDAPNAVLRDRYAARGDDLVSVHQALEAAQRYRVVMRGAQALYALERTTLGDVGNVARSLLREAHKRATGAARVDWCPGYVGDPSPAVLLVSSDRADHELPVFDMAVVKTIMAMPPEYRAGVGVVNVRDQLDLGLLYDALGAPHAVALGSAAHERLSADGVPHGCLEHPLDGHVPMPYVDRLLHAAAHQEVLI